MNLRLRALLTVIVASVLLIVIAVWGTLIPVEQMETRLELRNLPPSISHPFGTDWLGRDMLQRTLKGLSVSIQVGLAGAACSALIADCTGTGCRNPGQGRRPTRIMAH